MVRSVSPAHIHTPTQRSTRFCGRQPAAGYWKVSASPVKIMRWNMWGRCVDINMQPIALFRKKGNNVLFNLFWTSLVTRRRHNLYTLHILQYFVRITLGYAGISVGETLRVYTGVRAKAAALPLRDFQETNGGDGV